MPTDDLGTIAEQALFLSRWFIFQRLPAGLPRCVATKQQLYALCNKLGVPTPRVLFPQPGIQAREILKTVTLPVVVKASAAWLKSATKTLIVDSFDRLADILARADAHQERNLLIQEYATLTAHRGAMPVSPAESCDRFPSTRASPPWARRRATNAAAQVEGLVKTIGYMGIMDFDYRLDLRDGRYKLLDFNPRIGAQFRLFESHDGMDVARAMYLI